MKHCELNKDQELFRQIATGDEAAFREIFDKYIPKMRPVIRAILGTEDPVKDLMQDVFLLIWISREKLPEVHSPESWIFRIVHYECYKWLRKKRVREKPSENINITGLPSTSNSTEEYSNFEETSRLLKQAVSALPPQARKVFQMRRESDMKIEEIASILQVSPKTVKNTLTRALHSIQKYLEQYGIVLPLFILTAVIL